MVFDVLRSAERSSVARNVAFVRDSSLTYSCLDRLDAPDRMIGAASIAVRKRQPPARISPIRRASKRTLVAALIPERGDAFYPHIAWADRARRYRVDFPTYMEECDAN